MSTQLYPTFFSPDCKRVLSRRWVKQHNGQDNVLLSKKSLDAAHDAFGLSTLETILLQFVDNLVGVEVVVGDNSAPEERY